MRWRRAAIATSATVAAFAGAVGLVAGAVSADEAVRATRSGSVGTATDGGPSSPYRSSLTITLDGPVEPCPPATRPDRDRSPCRATIRLPHGASEDDVLRALGDPQRRRTLGADGEAWDYTWYVDDQLYALDLTTLTFDGHRLVDAQEYEFK